ncbi:MAG: hypothetical protein HY720_30240, partial [Planctomycetes bacterium]|nr:hypothetical protein [Planctomycetota bacterium]
MKRAFAGFLFLGAGLGVLAGRAAAVDRYWDGIDQFGVPAVNNRWTTAANWRQLGVNDDVIPAAGDNVFLDHTFVGAAYTVDQRQNVGGGNSLLNTLTINPRPGAFAGGTISILCTRSLFTGTLILQPDAGFNIEIRNSNGAARQLRVDTAIQIATTYVATGGTVNIGTFSAANDFEYDFDQILTPSGATFEIGPNVTVNMRLFNNSVANSDDEVRLAWLKVDNGATLTIDCKDNKPVATPYHYFRLLAGDAAFPGRALVVGAGATITLTNVGDDIVVLQDLAADSTCTFGDPDAVSETATVGGTGYFAIFRRTTFQRAFGAPAGTDNLTVSTTLWLQQSAAVDALTIEDSLDVNFSGTKFQHQFGSLTCGTTAANDGTVTIAGTTVGLAVQELPYDQTTVDVTHTVTVNGAGNLTYLAPINIYGNGVASGGQGRIVLNDSAVLNLGDAPADTTTLVGADDLAPDNWGGEIALNGSSTLNVSGDLVVDRRTTAGGQLTVNASAVANVTGAMNVNLAAAAGEDGGKVDVNGTGRVWVGGALTIQGQSAAAGSPARVTVNSTRAVSEGLAVTGTTTVQGGSTTNSRGELIVNTGATVLLTGAVAVNSGTGFGGQLTVNGTGVVNTGGALNVNLTAAAGEDGGKVDVNGTGRLSVGGALTIQGQTAAADTPARVTVNSTRGDPTVPPEGLAVTGTTTIQGGSTTNSRGELIVNTGALVLLTGAVAVNSGTGFGGQLTVNGTAVVNTGGALNVNLTAAASEDGGKVDVNGTGRLLVGGALLIQGQAVAADTPARLTIASTRGDPTVPPEGLVVTGITTIQGAPVGGNANSRGELIVSTDGLIQFTGGVTIASGSAQPGLLDVTDATAPGPTIRFAGDLTVNGLLRPRGSGGANFSTFQANGAGDQLYSGSTATLPLFYNLDITGGSGTKTLDLTPPMEVQNTFTVGAGATCRIPSGQDFRLARDKGAFPPDQHTVNGVFEIETGNSVDGTTKIKFGNRQQLLVTGAGSALTIVAGPEGMSFASNRDVLFTGDNATDAWSVHLADGASVSMEFVKIRRISGRTDESDLNAAEATEATVQTGLAISTARANITRFRAIDFDECLDGDDGAAPFARFPRYLYFISDADDLGWDGMGQLGILDALRFQNSGGLPGQSNIEKRTPAGAPVTNIYPRNAKDDIPPTGAAEDDDMDGDRGVPEDTGREDIIFYTNPTAVTLADLVATGYDSAVVVEWRTGQELDNLGFNLYRSPYPDRGWVQMNPSLILGLGDSQAGGRYALADRAVENGVRYFYLLEDVDVRGVRTLHGPVSAVPVAGLVMPELDPAEFVSLGNGDRGARADPAPGSARGPPGTSGDRRSRVTDVEALLGTDLMRAGIWLIEYDETGAVLLVVPPAPTLTPEVWDGELRTRIEMAGYGSTRVPGLPAVPEKRVLLVTPGIESASVRILEADSRRLAGLSPTRNAERGARNGGQGAGWDRNRPADPADIVRFLARARQEIMENRRRAREEIVRARAEAREILTRRSSMGHGPGAGAGAGG